MHVPVVIKPVLVTFSEHGLTTDIVHSAVKHNSLGHSMLDSGIGLLSSLLGILRICEQAELLITFGVASSSNTTFRHGNDDNVKMFQSQICLNKC